MARRTLEEIYGVSTTQQNTVDVPSMQIQNQPKRRSLEEIYGAPQQTNINQSFDQPTVTQPETFLSNLGTSAKETLIDPFTSRFGNIDYNNQSIASNALQTVGAVAGGAVDVLGKGLLGAAKLVTPKPVEQAVGSAVGAVGSGLLSAIPDSAKQSISDWALQHPEAAANLGAIVDIASIIPAGKSASVAKGALKTDAGVLAKAEQAVQRIAQPSKPELFNSAQAIRALETIPTEQIKTYSQLRTALQSQNTADLAKVTNEISKDTTKYRLRDFEINREGMKFNPVKDALVGLRELAEKTTDTNLMSKVRQFEIKVNTGEMIQNDVNELAKLVGRKINAFKQNGELLKRTNALKAENTRTSLKEIARTGMSPEVAALDKATSDRINFTARMDNIANAVQREINRSPNLNIIQKALGATTGVADFFMGRVMSNVVRALRNSNRLSAVEVEKELAKNLALVRGINKTKDINRVRELLKAAGIFATSQAVNQVNQPEQPQQ